MTTTTITTTITTTTIITITTIINNSLIIIIIIIIIDILKRTYKRSSSYTTLYLKEDGGLDDSNDSNKQKRKIISKKLIRPEDLDNLFNIVSSDDDDSDSNDIDNSSYSNSDDSINDDSDNNNNSNDNIIDNSVIPPITSSLSSKSSSLSSKSSSSSSSSIPSRYDVSGRETDEASSSMIELGNLEKMIRLPKSNVNNEQTAVEKEVVYTYKSEDEIDDEVNSAYTELDRILDKDKRNSVRESMSMKESRSSSSSSLSSLKSVKSVTVSTLDSPRSVQYNPGEYFRGDPMKYGAYRRWKLAEQEIDDKKNSKGKRKQGKVKKEKDNNPFNPENFYDSLKKLGSGPTSKDTPTGLGVADAPNNKKPITPKKGLTKKNKKKIITPDDIDKLFETKNAIKGTNNVEATDDDEEDDEDVEEEENNEDEDEDDNNNLISSPTIAMNPASSFQEMVSTGEEVPKWLADADKEAKKKRAMRGKKKKRLQDDWRFWLAIIASVGFVTAFWNIYQQSGGNFDNGPASFGFGMPTIGGGTGGGGDELVL
jgi:hypothetical protein